VRDQAGSTFTVIVATTITSKSPPLPFKRALADADLAAGTHQTRASRMGLSDQLDVLSQQVVQLTRGCEVATG